MLLQVHLAPDLFMQTANLWLAAIGAGRQPENDNSEIAVSFQSEQSWPPIDGWFYRVSPTNRAVTETYPRGTSGA